MKHLQEQNHNLHHLSIGQNYWREKKPLLDSILLKDKNKEKNSIHREYQQNYEGYFIKNFDKSNFKYQVRQCDVGLDFWEFQRENRRQQKYL